MVIYVWGTGAIADDYFAKHKIVNVDLVKGFIDNAAPPPPKN